MFASICARWPRPWGLTARSCGRGAVNPGQPAAAGHRPLERPMSVIVRISSDSPPGPDVAGNPGERLKLTHMSSSTMSCALTVPVITARKGLAPPSVVDRRHAWHTTNGPDTRLDRYIVEAGTILSPK